MPPYTQSSPWGALLSLLGETGTGIVNQHREQGIQDKLLAQQLAEGQSKLKTEGLNQQILQGQANQVPVDVARGNYKFASGVDPLAALLDKANLQKAGVNLPDNYIPQGTQNQMMQEGFQGNLLRSLMGGSAPPNAAPQAGGGAPAIQGTQPPAAAAPPQSGGGPLDNMPFVTKMRMAGLYQGPLTPGEEQANASASKTGGIEATQAAGQIPEAQQEVVNGYLQSYGMLANAEQALKNPTVLKGGAPAMQLQAFMYKNPVGKFAVSNDYKDIIPALDMSKQFLTKALAGGIRNQKVRTEIQAHMADSDSSPQAALQRIEVLKKYMPLLIRAQYATSGSQIPPDVMKAFGYTPEQWNSVIANADSDAAAANPGAPPQQGAAPQGANLAADPKFQAYAKQYFGGDVNKALAAQSR